MQLPSRRRGASRDRTNPLSEIFLRGEADAHEIAVARIGDFLAAACRVGKSPREWSTSSVSAGRSGPPEPVVQGALHTPRLHSPYRKWVNETLIQLRCNGLCRSRREMAD